MSKAQCAACGHRIDAAARLCPYCGADPKTGEKIDTDAMLREVFQPREVTTSQSIVEYARHRQGIVITIGVLLTFLVLAGLHQLVTMRNENAVTSAPAVPLSDIADVSDTGGTGQPIPMPKLAFRYPGNSRAMRTFILEPGAVVPPEVVAAQRAAAQQAAAQKAAAQKAAAQKGAGVRPATGPAAPTQPGATGATRPALPGQATHR